MRKKTTAEFISDAIKVHKGKYDYSKTNYISCKNKVEIICSIHGEFFQTASDHLSGHGCKKCKFDKLNKLRKVNLKEFLERARKSHNNFYDYSLIEKIYDCNNDKLKIICPIHRIFYQTASSHMSGIGCKECYYDNVRKNPPNPTITFDEFLERAKKIFRNKYKYKNYENISSKITIICPIHGEYEQLPYSHLKSKGCVKCRGTVNNLKVFISKANNIHNFRYDYSKSAYSGNEELITIICPIHGEFEQIARTHLSGSGCRFCYGKRKKTTKKFIKEVMEVHGNKYDYSKVDYQNWKTKVKIICPTHGEFFQRARLHLKGANCPRCANSFRKTTKEFVKEVMEVHGNTYNYSKTKYINSYTKIIIICSTHGEFKQNPRVHLRGSGCRICNLFKVSKISQDWLDNFKGIEKEVPITVGKNRFIVDGFNKNTNTIYEFDGDFWHGNPDVFNLNDKNKTAKMTFKKLNEKTLRKRNVLINAGYNLLYIWENDWNKIKGSKMEKYNNAIEVDGNKLTKKYIESLDDKQREKLIAPIFHYFRINGFQYPDDENKIKKDYKRLKEKEFDKNITELYNNASLATYICKYFCKSFYKTTSRGKPHMIDVFNDDKLLRKVIKNRLGLNWYKQKGEDDVEAFTISFKQIIQGIRSSRLVPMISMFKPSIAKFIYQKYSNYGDTILDYSAGFGGRMLGASVLDRRYIGIDPLTSFEINDIIKYLQIENCYLIKGISEEIYLKHNSIDLSFSSPPYYDLEYYSNDNTQAYNKGENYFYNVYWRKTLENSYKMLKKGKIFAVNVKDQPKMVEMAGDFFTYKEKIGLRTIRSHLNKKNIDPTKYEYIYIFEK